jgi:hypothetical protein
MSQAIAVFFSLIKASGGVISFIAENIFEPAVYPPDPEAVEPAYLNEVDLCEWGTVEFA